MGRDGASVDWVHRLWGAAPIVRDVRALALAARRYGALFRWAVSDITWPSGPGYWSERDGAVVLYVLRSAAASLRPEAVVGAGCRRPGML